jgi:hypothetical protein
MSGKTTSFDVSGGSSSRQMEKSRYGEVRDDRAERNHGCLSEVWLTTRSTMTRMPRSRAVRTSSTKSPSVPRRGSTPKKSVMS